MTAKPILSAKVRKAVAKETRRALREAIAASEARVAKIEKQLYVPPELVAELMKKGGNR